MATYATYNWKDSIQGETSREVSFTMNNSNAVMDLTNTTITAVFSLRGQPKLALTTPTEIVITDAANGKFNIPPFLVNLKPARYTYNISFVFPDGKSRIYIMGSWIILNR